MINSIKKITLESIAAGFAIGLGGCAFLAAENKYLGAFLFSLGLLAVCGLHFKLYTGMVSYHNNSAALLAVVLIGNWIGAWICGTLFAFAKPLHVGVAKDICRAKLGESWRVIILGFFCNILIYLAVEGYKRKMYVLLILCVMGFILSGFEHCIANMFYFTVANIFAPGYIVLNILGNTLGGITIRLLKEGLT